MIGRVMPMQVAGRLLMGLAIIMAVAMLGDLLRHERGMARLFRSRQRQRIMGGGQRHWRERQTGDHHGHGQLPQPHPEGGPQRRQHQHGGQEDHHHGSRGTAMTGAIAPSLPRSR